MSLPVILNPKAQDEFDEGYDFYEGRHRFGRIIRRCLQLLLDRIGLTPRLHRVVLGDIRRAVVQGFPYCVHYREEPTRVRVLSVFHTKRDPDAWQSRA